MNSEEEGKREIERQRERERKTEMKCSATMKRYKFKWSFDFSKHDCWSSLSRLFHWMIAPGRKLAYDSFHLRYGTE